MMDIVSLELDSDLVRLTRACNEPPQRERTFICDNCGACGRARGSCVSRIKYSCLNCGRLVGLDNGNRLSVLHSGDVRMAVVI